jgi:hypothetical protein
MTPAALVAASSSGRNSGGTHSDAGGGSPRHTAAAAATSSQALALLAAERARHADAEVRLQDALAAAQRDLQAQLAHCARVQAECAVQVATERARVVTLEAALAGRGSAGGGRELAERLQHGVLALQEERDGLAAALEAALAEAASVRVQLNGGAAAEVHSSAGEELTSEVETYRRTNDELCVEVEQLHQALELEWQRNRQARGEERREWVQKEAVLLARVAALESELQHARHR